MTRRLRARLRATGRTALAVFAVAAVSLSGLCVMPASAANAASSSAVTLTTSTATTQPVGNRFDYVLSWACSASGGTSCADLVIEVPVHLLPKSGQIEDVQRWGFDIALPTGSLAGFTHTVQRQGASAMIRFVASRAVPAGTQESISLSIRPHAATGDGVSFTVGDAAVAVAGGAPSTAAALTGTVTNADLPAPSIRVISGGQDPAGRGLVHYEILPKFDRVYDAATGSWQPWRAINTPATLTTVTAIDGTESVRVPLPTGAIPANISAGGSYDAQSNVIVWTAGSGFGNSPLQFTLDYDPTINNTVVQLEVERLFTETNGDVNRSLIRLPHRLQLVPIPIEAEFTKCGQGSVNGKPGERVTGQCQSVNYVTPVPQYSNDAGDWVQYKLAATKLEAGDQLRITDWAPCRTAPVAGGFTSQVGCSDPLAWFTGFAMDARTSAGGSPSLIAVLDDAGNTIETIGGGSNGNSQQQSVSFEEVELFRSDGQSVTLRGTTLNSLPQLPAGVHYVGFSGLTTPLQFPGIFSITPKLQISPTIDQPMTLQNQADWNLIRYGQEGSAVSTTGAAAIVRAVAGRTETTFLPQTGTTRSLRATFQTYALDPALGMPSYLLELPEGYVPQGGGLSSVRFLHNNSQQVSASAYELTFVPGDHLTGTRPMIRAVPKLGTAAVPAAPTNGWPLVTLVIDITPHTAAQFGEVEARSWVSVQGAGVQLDRCATQSSTAFIEGDAGDRDGDGVHDEDRFCRSAVARATYASPNSAAASVAVKEVRDAAGGVWVGANAVAHTPSGTAEYRLHWENAGSEPLSDVVLYDILPHPGDTGTAAATANVARGSAFAPEFGGLTTAVPAGTTLEYSASTNPCRPEVAQAPNCVNDWTTDLASIGTAQVRALKITLPGARPTGSGYNLYYEMTVPTGTASGVTAWNTLASHARHQGAALPAAETAKVGIAMPAAVTVAKQSPAAGGTVAVGETVSYTLTASNDLNSVANGVTLVDDLSGVLAAAEYRNDAVASTGTVSFDPGTNQLRWQGSLAPGETATITYSVRVTQATPSLMNRVTGAIGEVQTNCAQGTEAGCFVETTAHQPAVAIDKQARGVQAGTLVESNATLAWEYRVRNTGSEPLDGLAVTDDRGVVVTCPGTTLAVGAAMTCTGSGSVGTASPYTNVGTVTGAGGLTGASVTAHDSWSAGLIPLTTTLTIDKFAVAIAEGSTVDAETQVTWTYRVTNTGTDRLVQLAVSDDQGVTVSCPVAELEPGQATDCTGTGGVGFFGPYENTGTATAVGGYTAGIATGSDHWTVEVDPYETGVAIEKTAPGVTGQAVRPGTVIDWRYTVMNTGEEDLRDLVVADDRGVTVSCPATVLAVGASMICEGSGSVGSGAGQYTNIGSVTAETELTSTSVSAADSWSIEVRELVPALTLVKGATNARAGDITPVMHEVHWQYTVTNTGEDALVGVAVVDDQGVQVTCPSTELAVGAAMTCVGSGSVGSGTSYTNTATATATGELSDAPASDDSSWTVPLQAAELGLVIVKSAQQIGVGDTLRPDQQVTWEYVVTNTGREPLNALTVTDDQGVQVACEATELAAQATVKCVGTGSVGDAASYTNVGTATATGLWSGRDASGNDSWTAQIVRPQTGGGDPTPPKRDVVPEPTVDEPHQPTLVTTGTQLAAGLIGTIAVLLLAAGSLALLMRRRMARVGSRGVAHLE